MKKTVYIGLAAFLLFGHLAYAGIFGSQVRSGVYPLTMAKTEAEKNEAVTRVCPVLGTRLGEGEGHKVEYKGKTYYLCCLGCVREFKNNPEQYIERQKKK